MEKFLRTNKFKKSLAMQMALHLAFVIAAAAVFASSSWAAGKTYAIQIAAFKKIDSATAYADAYRKKGLDVFIRLATVKDKGDWYRVYLQQHARYATAKAEALRLKQAGIISSFFVRAVSATKKAAVSQKKAHNSLSDEAAPSGSAPKDAPMAVPTDNKEKVAPPLLLIESVQYEAAREGREWVWIQAEREFAPEVLFAPDQKGPRIVITVYNAKIPQKGLEAVRVKGGWIKAVASKMMEDRNALTVTLWLEPGNRYEVSQVYQKAQKRYGVQISSQKQAVRAEKIENPDRIQG